MPTVLSHPAVPLAAGVGLGSTLAPPRLVCAAVVASVLPDLDVLAFRFGVPYEAPFGHRGATHSLAFAAAVALAGALAHRALRARTVWAAAVLFVATASHGLLDACTDGGRGVALLWPWSSARFFAAVRPIEVSPIGIGFFSERGLDVLASELRWVWLPCAAAALVGWGIRRLAAGRRTG
jgi:inner membrane protein